MQSIPAAAVSGTWNPELPLRYKSRVWGKIERNPTPAGDRVAIGFQGASHHRSLSRKLRRSIKSSKTRIVMANYVRAALPRVCLLSDHAPTS
jgi:hypothetical protein